MTPIIGILASSSASSFLGDYESIATVVVTGATQANIEFTSIPSTYQHLQIRLFGRTDRVATRDAIRIQFNNDTTSGNYYTNHYIYGDGATAFAGADGTGTGVITYRTGAASSSANVFGGIITDILDYRSTNKHKTLRSLGGSDNNGSGEIHFTSGMWFPSTIAAITSIKLIPSTGANFVTNTHAALYGIKG